MGSYTKRGYHKSIFKSRKQLFVEGIEKMFARAVRLHKIPSDMADLFIAERCELRSRPHSDVMDLYVDGHLVDYFPKQ